MKLAIFADRKDGEAAADAVVAVLSDGTEAGRSADEATGCLIQAHCVWLCSG